MRPLAALLLALPLALPLACTQRAAERPDGHVTSEAALVADAGAPAGQDPSPAAPAAAPENPDAAESFEACLDRVLKEAGLNRYGDADGTMYAGGTPLFDERTGESVERRAYVAQRRPELVARCEGR